MYSRHHDSMGVVSDLLGLALVLFLIAAYLTLKTTLFVIRTFVRYYDHRSLWISLAVCILLTAAGLRLASQGSPSLLVLLFVGVTILLVTCLVVDLRNRDTFLRENVHLIDEVLHSNWFASEDTPQKERVHEQIAA